MRWVLVYKCLFYFSVAFGVAIGIPVYCQAQQATIAELRANFQQANDFKSKIDFANDLARRYWFTHPDSAAYFAEYALKKSSEQNYHRGQAIAYNSL
ncbi:MAG TPA: hypothetical protein DCM08_04565, partial [Microscillaceae bacterium]|nr:hypothetical protein [Microscillaceae bacterium]